MAKEIAQAVQGIKPETALPPINYDASTFERFLQAIQVILDLMSNTPDRSPTDTPSNLPSGPKQN